MKKVFLGFLVFAALSLACAGAALAAPVGPSGEGFSVFADYEDDYYDSFSVGAGYGFNDILTVGVFYLVNWENVGIYANLALGPVLINGELVFDPDCMDGFFSALYAFDLDPITLGAGVGSYFCEFGGFEGVEIVAMAQFDMDPLTVFVGVHSPLDSGDIYFKAGASCLF